MKDGILLKKCAHRRKRYHSFFVVPDKFDTIKVDYDYRSNAVRNVSCGIIQDLIRLFMALEVELNSESGLLAHQVID